MNLIERLPLLFFQLLSTTGYLQPFFFPALFQTKFDDFQRQLLQIVNHQLQSNAAQYSKQNGKNNFLHLFQNILIKALIFFTKACFYSSEKVIKNMNVESQTIHIYPKKSIQQNEQFSNIILQLILFISPKVMNLSDLMSNIAAKNEGKLGYTTTVKQQVDSIENNIDNFKKVLESQRKQQRQIQYELKKMQEQSKTSFHDLQQEISERVNYLTEQLKSDNNAQGKQFEYLQLQNKNLYDQHDKLNELATNVSGRTQQAQTNVGM